MAKPFKQLVSALSGHFHANDLDAATAALKRALTPYPPDANEQDVGKTRHTLVTPGEFGHGTFNHPNGRRHYRLYVPHAAPLVAHANSSALESGRLPLVVMLHGCHQNPEDFAAGTRMNALAERSGCCVLYPAQSHRANGSGCWNWFRTADQQRGMGEPSIIADLVTELCGHYPIDRQRIYVAGLSAGGAFAANLAVLYPDLFAAAAVHSGLPFGAAHDLLSGLRVMRQGAGTPPASNPPAALVPLIVFQGDADETVNPANAAAVIAQALPTGGMRTRIEQQQTPGHPVTHTQYFDLAEPEPNPPRAELWMVHGAGHGWMGGSPRGSFTEPAGPDASTEMLRFFLTHVGVGQH